MTNLQYCCLNEYIENTLNRKFTVDEHDYKVTEIYDEMPTNDIDKVCIVFIEINGFISYHLAIFKNNQWLRNVIENGLVSDKLTPINFSDSTKYLGYTPYKEPFIGEITENNFSEILKSVKTKFPKLKCKEKKDKNKFIELSFKTSNNVKYRLHKGFWNGNNMFVAVVSDTQYYQCKTKERLLQLVEKLINGTNNIENLDRKNV